MIFAKEPVTALKLRSALQGDDQQGRKQFDFSISNVSAKQVILNSFHVRWVYKKGPFAAVEPGMLLQPTVAYSINLSIDTDKASSLQEQDLPMSPPILLPPRNQSGPSITTIRLEVLYNLVGRLNYHPYDGWNIFYQVEIRDDTGDSLQLVSKDWKHDRNIDWLRDYQKETK
jgi:hypothetical protein